MNGATTIRPAEPSDADAVRELVELAYAPYVERIGTPPAPMLDDYDELIERHVVHVAADNDRIIGVIVMWPNHDHFYIDNIASHPQARRSGVGAALLAWAEQRAHQTGRHEIRLYTNAAMTENLHYYERRGFTETHRTSDSGYERVHLARSPR